MKIAFIITTFNRPDYLQECFDSIRRADLSQISTLLIIDDRSTDEETIRLINEFDVAGVEIIKVFSKENRSIRGSLLHGFDLLFASHDLCMNLDGDGIIRNDAISVLLALKGRFYSHIVSGFNTTVENRNPIISEHEDYFFKKYVSGINFCINKEQYDKWVRPSLLEHGNFDYNTSLKCQRDNMPVVVAKPSVVQHRGRISSMGHTNNGTEPDMAFDFKILALKNVTLIAIDDNVNSIIKAADISCMDIDFGFVKLLSSMPSNDPRVLPIRYLGSKKSYSEFVMKEIVDYISTPYFMVIQGDGWIVRAESWENDWYKYDYIGSPWEWYVDGYNTGNGAASFRSQRLHQILKDDNSIVPTNDHLIKECQEDHNICRIYRRYLEENYDIKFAPIEVARKFGIEAWGVKPPGNKYTNQFCFHGKNIDFSESDVLHKPY